LYDEGLRFDLRLPYAERGYEDPDSDVMGNFSKGLSNLFGGKKKMGKGEKDKGKGTEGKEGEQQKK
jgi:hypothetical protein